MTTYYVNGSGAPYTDPQGDVWGAGDDGNAGNRAAPKLTIPAGLALMTANSDELIIAPATYNFVGATAWASPSKTDLYIHGADTRLEYYPVIDVSGITGSGYKYSLYVRASNIIKYIKFANAPAPGAAPADGNYSALGIGGDLPIVECCWFQNNYRDVHLGANYSYIHRRNLTENAKNYCIYCVSWGTGKTLTVAYNKFLGYYPDNVPVGIEINSDNTAGTTINIHNNNFMGLTNYAIVGKSTFKGIANINNNVFSGNKSSNILWGAALAAENVDYNEFTASGWCSDYLAGSVVDGFNIAEYGASVNSGNAQAHPGPEKTNSLIGYRNESFIVLRFDDHIELDIKLAIAQKLYSRGMSATLGIAAGVPSSADWVKIKQLQDLGFEICCHGYSHISLDNDAGTVTPFTVTYTGAGVWALDIVTVGAPPTDAVTLTLSESVTGDNVSINLVTGAITGDTTTEDLKTLDGLKEYLDTKAYFTISNYTVPNDWDYPEVTLSRTLVDCSLSGAGAKNISHDVSKLHYYEMEYPKTLFIANAINPVTTFIYPNFKYDSTTITDLLSYGYVASGGTNAYSDWTMGQQLDKMDLFEMAEFSWNRMYVSHGSDWNNVTAAIVQAFAHQLCEALSARRATVAIMSHGNADDTLPITLWDTFLDAIEQHKYITVASQAELSAYIIANGATTDGGITYNRTVAYSPIENYKMSGMHRGTTAPWTGVANVYDYAGKQITNASGNMVVGWVSMGADQVVGTSSSMSLNLGLGMGSKIPPRRRGRRKPK